MVILAEKTFRLGQSLGGVIKIYTPHPRSLQGPQYELKCRIDLSQCGGIVIGDLLNDLKNHDARYSVQMNNCWKYAYDASREVLNRCEELPDTSRQTKYAIRRFRESTLVRQELLGECVTLSRIITVGVGCALLAGLLWWYNPFGVTAQTAVRGLGIGLTSRNLSSRKAKRNCMIFVPGAVCSGIAFYGCAECGLYYMRLVYTEVQEDFNVSKNV